MNATERQLRKRTLLFGCILTILTLVLQITDAFDPLERWLYDARVRQFQHFTPPPTDRLVHVDITDSSLETIGWWPWPRSEFAAILESIHQAGPKVIALDVLFAESAPVEHRKMAQGGFESIDHDAEMVRVIGNAAKDGCIVLVPFSSDISESISTIDTAALQLLLRNLTLTEEKLNSDLLKSGRTAKQLGGLNFIKVRREAMFKRVNQALAASPKTTKQTLVKQLLPSQSQATETPLMRLFESQHARAISLRKLSRHSLADTGSLSSVIDAQGDTLPIDRLSAVTGTTGFVDYLPDRDGVVRVVPMWEQINGRLYPQMSLAMACAFHDVKIKDLNVTSSHITIPSADGDIDIPVHTRMVRNLGHKVGSLMNVSWFGPDENWLSMYGDHSAQHVPIDLVWKMADLERSVPLMLAKASEKLNLPNAINDVPHMLKVIDDRMEGYRVGKKLYDAALGGEKAFAEHLASETELMKKDNWSKEEIDEEVASMRDSRNTIVYLHSARPRLQSYVKLQNRLRSTFEGKVALIGWTARGKVDFVPTSLHARAPGVVVHGAIFNSLMTREFWQHAPRPVGPAITVVIGLLIAVLTTLLGPVRALIASALVVAAHIAINGLWLFDYHNIITPAGAPLVAVGVVWSGCTMSRFILERKERARVTDRFRSRVDPALVNYVLEHRDQARFDGEVRELSVVFTDLAGFTTLSEQLQERTVPLLNDFMSRMVPVVRKNNGYVNKFLGDGMMFFYGAPVDNQMHAADAVSTVLRMQELMGPFNEELTKQNLPNVAMRCGVSSGNMVVGDAGSVLATRREDEASDYTVLGDVVNLGSRLEGANKATGTLIMINERTAELVEDMFLLRPVGRLQVVGKTKGVMTFEPLAWLEQATDAQRELADMTREFVEAFIAGEFQNSITAINRMDAAVEPGKLTALYRRLCEQYLEHPPEGDFDGCIVLESK